MQIQIQLCQSDIENAIRDYLVKVGMTSPVDTINFAVSRKGGQTIDANIDLTPEGTVRNENAVPEPVEDTAPAPAVKEASAKPKQVTTKAKADVTTPKPEAKEPEPAQTEPPFTPDAEEPSANDSVEDSTEVEPTKSSKSLFS